jgi:copper chaperone
MLNWFKKGNSGIKVSTNINCASCVAKVKPFLDEDNRIDTWEVDTLDPKKVLAVKGSISLEELAALITKAGYTIKQ